MKKARGARRWPLVIANGNTESPTKTRFVLMSCGALLLAGASLVPGLPLALRFALGVLAVALLVFGGARKRKRVRYADASLFADTGGLTRESPDGAKPIVEWGSPFGVMLLASYGRPQGLLAFTTPSQTRYVPTRIDGRSETDDELFARIAVLADLDLIDGVAHEAALSADTAAGLLRYVDEHDRSSLGRVFLSDGRGAPIALDRATLSIARRSFDLTSHLEWRPLMFHEAAALYQATWIRQNGAEVVLVAPMPASIVPREPNAYKEAAGRLGRALTRDLRLLQAPAEPPPARDMRVAIDRPFMMAVRRALDEAPLALRVTLPAPKEALSEGRDSIS